MEQKKKVPVLTIRDLSITFRTTAGPVNAIRGVNIDLMRGETLAIVGESGSGKSVTFKAVMGILAKNSEVNSGSIKYSYFDDDGSPAEVDILKMKKGEIPRRQNRCLFSFHTSFSFRLQQLLFESTADSEILSCKLHLHSHQIRHCSYEILLHYIFLRFLII